MTRPTAWPNGKKIAVSVTVMFETWSEGAAPNYSVQTTHLKSGTVDHASKAWSTYGGRVGVWRIIRMLDRLQIPGTFFTNGRCTEDYPDAVKQIVKSGHDIAAHAYTQDQLLAYMSLEDRTVRSPACRPRISPTTASCARARAISTTPTAAPSTIWSRTRR